MQRSQQGQLYTDIFLEIFRLNGVLVNVGDELSKPFGLTSARWKVLGAIVTSNTPMTVSDIAHSMGQTRQSVQRLGDVLVSEDILVYQDNPKHKKAKLLALTPKGEALYQRLDNHYSEWVNQIAETTNIKALQTTLQVLKEMSSVN